MIEEKREKAPFKYRFAVWVWNGCNAFLNGVATGILTVVGGQVAGAADFTLRQVGVVAVVGGAVAWFNYVRQSPLPQLDTYPG